MIITAELLLQYQRCKRRSFLDTFGDQSQRDAPSDLLLKLRQDSITHQKTILAQQTYQQPDHPKGDWEAGAKATLELMQQGVECIYKGVLLTNYSEEFTLLSRPDLLFKQPGKSRFGDWIYAPAEIELGKRPKLEYQIKVTFHSQVLATVQEAAPATAWLLLRRKDAYTVSLSRWIPQMQSLLDECIESLKSSKAPEVFISRQRCSLCRWYSQCYAIAKSQQHLSLLPGITPTRYTQLQSLKLTDLESLANCNPTELETIPGFEGEVAQRTVLQAQSVVENRPILLSSLDYTKVTQFPTSPIEIYFDIEAEPDLNLDYLLGVLVVDRQANTETFYSLLAERPEEEELIWQQFLDLVWQYPQAPIYHFFSYEVDTVKRLAKLYHTPPKLIRPLIERFVDVYEQVMQTLALPVEGYALKAIARWLGFEWRNPQANGSQCICWYDQWLETGDHTLLDAIQSYNEDDCRATRHVKDWFVGFMQNAYPLELTSTTGSQLASMEEQIL